MHIFLTVKINESNSTQPILKFATIAENRMCFKQLFKKKIHILPKKQFFLETSKLKQFIFIYF